jgi:hypothetical protein
MVVNPYESPRGIDDYSGVRLRSMFRVLLFLVSGLSAGAGALSIQLTLAMQGDSGSSLTALAIFATITFFGGLSGLIAASFMGD